MDEYIKREEAVEAAKHAWAKGLEPSQYLEIITSADVAPVRHGRWVEQTRLYYGAKQYVCSLCCAEAFWDKHEITNKYPCCPNCGAMMDGGAD